MQREQRSAVGQRLSWFVSDDRATCWRRCRAQGSNWQLQRKPFALLITTQALVNAPKWREAAELAPREAEGKAESVAKEEAVT